MNKHIVMLILGLMGLFALGSVLISLKFTSIAFAMLGSVVLVFWGIFGLL